MTQAIFDTLKGRLTELAARMITLEAVLLISSVIALTGLIVWVVFVARSRPINQLIRVASRRLASYDNEAEFSSAFESIDKWAKTHPILGHAWREFSETLIFPKEKKEGQVIRNTYQSALYFNEHTLVSERMNLRFYQAFPNFLTGAGILGTFIGLFCAILLAKENLGPGGEPAKGIAVLLDGASLAFLTSIAGITSSIMFSVAEKRSLHRLHRTIAQWNHVLDERLELVTPEQLSAEYLEEAKRQTVQLEKFNTDLAVSIASALDEKMAGRLAPGLEKLIEAVEGLRGDRAETNHEILRKIVAEFKSSLSGAAEGEMTSTVNALHQVNQVFESTMTKMSDGQRTLEEVTGRMANDVEKAIQRSAEVLNVELAKSMQKIQTDLIAGSESASGLIKEAGMAAGTQMANAARGFEESVTQLATVVDKSRMLMDQTQAIMSEIISFPATLQEVRAGIEEAVVPMTDAAQGLREAGSGVERAMGEMQALFANIGGLSNQMQRNNEQLTTAWTDYVQRFESVDQSLKHVFVEINDGLDTYTEKIKGFVVELDNSMAKAISGLTGAIGELGDMLEEMSELKKGLKE